MNGDVADIVDSASSTTSPGTKPELNNKENVKPADVKCTAIPLVTDFVAQQGEVKLYTQRKVVFGKDHDNDDEASIASDGTGSSEDVKLAQMITLKRKRNQEPDDMISAYESKVPSQNSAGMLCELDEHPRPQPLELVAIKHSGDSQGDINISCSELEVAKLTRGASEPSTSCFICGCSFQRLSTGYKGRLNHMKRCSKKHGVTAQLMKIDDDVEDFQPSPVRRDTVLSNPYTKVNKEWHAGAEQDLRLAGKQTIMSSFFDAPVKSINNVLMAGAKRIAKTGDLLLAAAKKKQTQKQGGSWGSASRNRGPCPFYKKIPGTDFVCDGFMYAIPSLTKNYFLTHFHSDHYGGINKSWNAGIIYCSLPTANLVSQQLGVDKKYLHPLGMNTPVVIESQGKPVTVILLDANHCPGAVMFLFQVGRRHILHVGDFRWNRDRMFPGLKEFMTLKIRLDDLFLDTTYCNEKYSLPTQEEAIAATVAKASEEVESCRKAGKRLLMLFGAYTIGKERIYLAVAEKLGTKVYVDKTRHRILSSLNWPPDKLRLFTTDKEASFLWVVPLGHINFNKLPLYSDGSNKVFSKRSFDKIVGFRPTGWTMTGCKDKSILNSRTNGIFTVHGVPYSEHSSFPELVDCLECLKPKRIIPTVSVAKSDEQVALLLKAVNDKKIV